MTADMPTGAINELSFLLSVLRTEPSVRPLRPVGVGFDPADDDPHAFVVWTFGSMLFNDQTVDRCVVHLEKCASQPGIELLVPRAEYRVEDRFDHVVEVR